MTKKELLQKVHDYFEKKDMNGLKTLLKKSNDLDILEVIKDLSSKELVTVYRLLQKDKALFIFENLDTLFQLNLIKSFTEEQSKDLIAQLDPDDRVRLLDELPATVVKRMMASLSKEEREMTTLLMGYESYTAGRIMTPEYIRINRKATVKEALEKIKSQAEKIESIYTIYITDDKRKLEGVITLRELMIAKETNVIEKIMSAPTKVYTDTDQEIAANTLKDLDLVSLPVVDKQGLLVGIITFDDAMDILEEEATDDALDKAGFANIKKLEHSRSEVLVKGSFLSIWKIRVPFLLIALAGGLLAAIIMGEFEEILETHVILAFFIPVIMDMGGSVGTQSSTVFSRGYLLGHVRVKKFGSHLLKETLVGFTMGLMKGFIAGGIILLIFPFFFEVDNMLRIAFAVGLSLAVVMTLASFVGFTVPFVLFKLGVDQGAGKDPIITTIKDLTGILVYFAIASLILGRNLYDGLDEATTYITSFLGQ